MKIKFIIFTFITIILFSFIFTACDYQTISEETVSDESMFVIVEDTHFWFIMYHKYTKVMYIYTLYGSGSGDIEPLLNPDGTLQLWNGE